MSKRSPNRVSPFTPSPEQMACWPDISGNKINGVGEAGMRRPSRIMWHDPDTQPHGQLQNWFWKQGANQPELREKRTERQKVINVELPPIADEKQQVDPADASDRIRQLALDAGADLVGIIPVQDEWVFEGYDFDYPWMVILGVAMDFDKLATAPEITAGMEVVDKYTYGWVVARPAANWIRSRGWRAEPKGGPLAGPVNLLPAAIECGFGELGKHGSLINRQLGSRFRLSAVFTDLPLVADGEDRFGADDFCAGCQVCVRACPVDAIGNDKVLVRGEHKWYVDFDRCMPYFAETFGCAICIAVCPWSKPDRAPVLADRWTRISQRRHDPDGRN
ncbi:MAG: 4Fe-4S dicluster domain-containing protein [Xanthomonadales bacterium]|nr:4Fe-4S dicluster domain-containing protein [Xanthomonadales bacterium]